VAELRIVNKALHHYCDHEISDDEDEYKKLPKDADG